MKIIGFTGAAGAGKDTAARFALDWCAEHGISAERFAFADPLKVSAARALGFRGTEEQCVEFCDVLKRPGSIRAFGGEYASGRFEVVAEISGRQFLQFYGTEAHRDMFGSNFWVEVTERKLAEAAGTLEVAFLTDPRFDNEADMIHAHGGEIWRVVRPGQETVEQHASEA